MSRWRCSATAPAYPRNFGKRQALVTDRRLEDGMPVILDAAPVSQGSTVDTTYAFAHGSGNVLQREVQRALLPLRALILRRVREGESFRTIAREVDGEICALSYENCHRKHIGAVLAHRESRACPTAGSTGVRGGGLGVPSCAHLVVTTSWSPPAQRPPDRMPPVANGRYWPIAGAYERQVSGVHGCFNSRR